MFLRFLGPLPSFLLALTLLTATLPALGRAATTPTNWKINGNGYTGLLVLSTIDSATNEVSGTLLGTPVTGFLVGRHLVLHRYPQGSTQIWDGWITDPKLGAPGQAYYDSTPIIAGFFSENKGLIDGVYPWYGTALNFAPPPAVNLLINGSFEFGAVGNSIKKGVSGWTVTRDNIDVVQGYWQQLDGKRSIDLAGTYGSGAIAQTFITDPGRTYEVTFFIAGNPECDNPGKYMRISAAGQNGDFSFNTTGRKRSQMGWEKTTWTFSATSSSTTLVLENMGPNRGCGIALDNVSVSPR